MKNPTATGRNVELIGTVASWLVPLVVYSFTLAPGVMAGDSGDFVVAVHRFSLPHPPGYPLYMLLAKIWTILPINLGANPLAVKMNMFSMVAMVLACAVFYRLARSLTGSVAAALGAALIFAFSRSIWKFAEITEVYALNTLLVLLVLWGLASAREGKRSGLLLTALSFGLGLAHHYSIVLLLPIAIVLWPRGKDAVKVSIPVLLAAFVLPLLLYLLLPVMAMRTPQYSETGFTFRNFIDTVTRAEYRERPKYQDLPEDQLVTSSDIMDRATRYLPKQFRWVLLILCVAGWFVVPSGKRAWGLMSAITLGLWIFAMSYLTRGSPLGMPFSFLRSVDEFMLPANIFLAMGFAWLLAPLSNALTRKRDFSGTEGLNIIPTDHIPITIALLLCVPAVFLGMANGKYSNMTRHTYVQDQARNVLEQVPENGVLVTSGDESYLFDYLQQVRGIRGDVELVVYPFVRLVEAGGGQKIILPPVNSLAYFIDSELGDRPCVFSFSPPATILPLLEPPRSLRLDGIAQTLVVREPGMGEFFPGDPNTWLSYQLRNLDRKTMGTLDDPPVPGAVVPDDSEVECLSRYAQGLRVTAAQLQNSGYAADYYVPMIGMAKTLENAISFTDYPAFASQEDTNETTGITETGRDAPVEGETPEESPE